MSGYISASVFVDRDAGTFDVQISYWIDPYIDPETGEYFGDTSWTATYAVVGEPGGGTGGYAAESETVILSLGLGEGEDVVNSTLGFGALNMFSGAAVYAEWNVLAAAYATGAKIVAGTAGMDIIVTGSGDDTLSGGAGDDILNAGDGTDTLDGGDANDTLDGGLGDDVLIGGAGDDFYWVDSAADTLVEQSNGGYDTAYVSVSYTLGAFVEQLIMNSNAALDATGNGSDNRLYGNNAVNTLDGLGGNDLLYGYDGDDTLRGGSGNDLLDGGTGQDRMEGGSGDDIYIVDSFGDQVVELAGGGVDTVRVAGLASYTLGAEIEDLNLLWGLDFHGTGNNAANVLIGGLGNDTLLGLAGDDRLQGEDGNDTLLGGAGADQLVGGAGQDRASYETASQGVSLNLATGGTRGDALGDTFAGVEDVLGSAFADTIVGDGAANLLSGGAGNDRIFGGAGRDVLIGGAGADFLSGGADQDRVSYAGSIGAVSVNLATGRAAGGDAQGDVIIGFEDAAGGNGDDVLTGNRAANTLFGDAGADRIHGGAGDDTIEGGAGPDTMFGGAGFDRLSYAGSPQGVIVNLGTGLAVGGHASGDRFGGFEGVIGSAFADNLTGGGGDDTIDGGPGADVMDGGGGFDTLSYAAATSWVSVSLQDGTGFGAEAEGDRFANFEHLIGGRYGDALYGNALANRIDGGAGGDYLSAGGGNDVLIGGEGDDFFYFGESFGHDLILDFRAGGDFEDSIGLGLGFDFDSFSEVMAVAAQSGPDTVLNFASDARLTLAGVQLAALTEADFHFG